MESKTTIQDLMRERATLEKCRQMINDQLKKLLMVVGSVLSEFELGQDVMDGNGTKWKIVNISVIDSFQPFDLMGSKDVLYTGKLFNIHGHVMQKEFLMGNGPFTSVSTEAKTYQPDKAMLKACAEEIAEWTKAYHDCQVDLNETKEDIHALTENQKMN